MNAYGWMMECGCVARRGAVAAPRLPPSWAGETGLPKPTYLRFERVGGGKGKTKVKRALLHPGAALQDPALRKAMQEGPPKPVPKEAEKKGHKGQRQPPQAPAVSR
jgi:hypothetical protein